MEINCHIPDLVQAFQQNIYKSMLKDTVRSKVDF